MNTRLLVSNWSPTLSSSCPPRAACSCRSHRPSAPKQSEAATGGVFVKRRGSGAEQLLQVLARHAFVGRQQHHAVDVLRASVLGQVMPELQYVSVHQQSLAAAGGVPQGQFAQRLRRVCGLITAFLDSPKSSSATVSPDARSAQPTDLLGRGSTSPGTPRQTAASCTGSISLQPVATPFRNGVDHSIQFYK